MMTFEMLTGQTRDHVINFAGNHHLQFNATKAFLAMQKAAATAGFKLMPASSFRDFSRQQIIWNEKFAGVRTVNDAENRPLDVSGLSEAERCQAILRWSAIPGASRHHWGTEVDYYDPFRLPADIALQLEPWNTRKAAILPPFPPGWRIIWHSLIFICRSHSVRPVVWLMNRGISATGRSLMKRSSFTPWKRLKEY